MQRKSPRDHDASVTTPASTTESSPIITSTPHPSFASAWFPSSKGKEALKKIPWAKYKSMIASALTTSNPRVLFLDAPSQELLADFVAHAKNNSVKAVLSIGGPTGSRYFSKAVSVPLSRTDFVQAVVDIATRNQLDGIEFAWEYPGQPECDGPSKDDTTNYLLFLEELRKHSTGSRLAISAAVPLAPFLSDYGTPRWDVTAFASFLDYITIVAYDVWKTSFAGSNKLVGPNAPVYDDCALPSARSGSIESAVSSWSRAGFPKDRIVLGVPSHGRVYSVDSIEAQKIGNYPKFDAIPAGQGEKPGTLIPDACNINNTVPVNATGVVTFEGLISAGYLDNNGSLPSSATISNFDQCSLTPFFYNSTREIMVSYDDVNSMALKGHYIRENGLKGFALSDAVGDYNDLLLDSVRNATSLDRSVGPNTTT
ncbi:unnamed protein product [Cyclocybe aegerita]|uniref:GH18 domain-containing protein n=1 Tax=Cyclocybe aegerita TaxID=1973307 RepID=A0A8S0VZB6_CYCAE|nr:unnamed protein product [Cyclocybe aegerita]